jgi:hypothetical protein
MLVVFRESRLWCFRYELDGKNTRDCPVPLPLFYVERQANLPEDLIVSRRLSWKGYRESPFESVMTKVSRMIARE